MTARFKQFVTTENYFEANLKRRTELPQSDNIIRLMIQTLFDNVCFKSQGKRWKRKSKIEKYLISESYIFLEVISVLFQSYHCFQTEKNTKLYNIPFFHQNLDSLISNSFYLSPL